MEQEERTQWIETLSGPGEGAGFSSIYHIGIKKLNYKVRVNTLYILVLSVHQQVSQYNIFNT